MRKRATIREAGARCDPPARPLCQRFGSDTGTLCRGPSAEALRSRFSVLPLTPPAPTFFSSPPQLYPSVRGTKGLKPAFGGPSGPWPIFMISAHGTGPVAPTTGAPAKRSNIRGAGFHGGGGGPGGGGYPGVCPEWATRGRFAIGPSSGTSSVVSLIGVPC